MKVFAVLGLQLVFLVLYNLGLCYSKFHHNKKHTLNNDGETSFAENVTVTLTEPITHKRNPVIIENPSQTGSFMDFNNNNQTYSFTEKAARDPTFNHLNDEHFTNLSNLGKDYNDNGEYVLPEDHKNHREVKHYATTIKTLNTTNNNFTVPEFNVKENTQVHIQKLLPADATVGKFRLQELNVVKEGNILVGRVYEGQTIQFEPILHDNIPASYKEAIGAQKPTVQRAEL